MTKQLFRKIISFFTACLMCFWMPLTVRAADGKTQMNNLVNSYSKTSAVLVYSLEDGVLYTWHKNTEILGASLIKLPYAYYACTQIEAGVHSLSETMTYTSSWYHGGSGIICKNGYGKSYTIRQLLDYAMRYSDNVAYDMLVYLFGTAGFNSMVKDWGYSVSISTPSPRFPPVTADFMRTAMQKVYENRNNGECWQTVWNGLCNSTTSYVRPVLAGTTAVKYGNVSTVWHETCFVDGDYPYIVVIMTTISNNTPNVTFIQNAAKAAGQIVKDYLNEKALLQQETDLLETEPEETIPPETEPEEIIPPETEPEEIIPPETEPEETIPPETEPEETIPPETEPEETQPETLPYKGDINNDGTVNALDAAEILKEAVSVNAGNESILTEEQKLSADLDADANISANDASLILKFSACSATNLIKDIRTFLMLLEFVS